jgi:RNA polymerase sigma factor (TIGR02999 family)
MKIEAAVERGEITELLIAYGRGDRVAFERLVERLYPELRRAAHRQLLARGRPDDAVLDTGGLVQEAYFKLVDGTRVSWRDRGHFLAVAACAMRQVILDHARARRSQKRGAAAPHVPLDGHEAAIQADAEHLLAVHEALDRLEQADERLRHIVDCRFFAGYTEEETAEALGISTKTVEREWVRARVWLRTSIGSG